MYALSLTYLAHMAHLSSYVRSFVADNVVVTPTAAGAPGANLIQTMLNWGAQYALWACLGAIILGGAIYGFATHAGNSYRGAQGRNVALAGAVGAAVVGLAPTAVNLVFHAA